MKRLGVKHIAFCSATAAAAALAGLALCSSSRQHGRERVIASHLGGAQSGVVASGGRSVTNSRVDASRPDASHPDASRPDASHPDASRPIARADERPVAPVGRLTHGTGVAVHRKQPAPARTGMVVGIDPETGALGMPSPEQLRALRITEGEALSTSSEGLIFIHRPDGAVGVDLQGRFQDYAVARIGSDGRPIFGCIHSDGFLKPARPDSIPMPSGLEEE